VTNPCKPEFLWQFTDPNLGDTYGQPTAAQIFVEDSDPTPLGNSGGPVVFSPRQSRGVILLPGGQGIQDAGTCTYSSGPELPEGMDTATGTSITPRSDRRCWRGTTSSPPAARHGRSIYFIDLITGTLIREIGEDVFPAPLNGAVSVFRGDTGTVGSVAYTVDADGVLWRIDFSSPDPDDWGAEALHDLYYDEGFDSAEPTYYPPSLSVNSNSEIVILVGTGNIDVLDDATAINKVVSITEKLTFDSNGFIDTLEGRLNWEIELDPGEQMTGPLELFGGQVYFGTFKAGGGSAVDACPLGASRIFGVSFLDNPSSAGALLPLLQDSLGNATVSLDSTDISELSNALLVGLQVAQQPVCTLTDDITVTDPFTGQTSTLAMPWATSGREFKLMAHLSGSTALSGGLSIAILEEGISAPEGFTVVSGMAATLE
jgi:type IV pilus assembly protein PilY1